MTDTAAAAITRKKKYFLFNSKFACIFLATSFNYKNTTPRKLSTINKVTEFLSNLQQNSFRFSI